MSEPASATATKDHDDSMMVDAWRCGNCSGLTYDAYKFEVPTYCCRCGAMFINHFDRKSTQGDTQ